MDALLNRIRDEYIEYETQKIKREMFQFFKTLKDKDKEIIKKTFEENNIEYKEK